VERQEMSDTKSKLVELLYVKFALANLLNVKNDLIKGQFG
jgi:hypothetical protein